MNRRQLAIVGGLTIVVLFAWFTFLWSPKGAALSEAGDRQAAAADQVAQLRQRLVQLQAAQRRAPELQATMARLHSAVPATPDLAQFLLDTDDAAAKAGVDFLSVSPSPPAAKAGAPTEVVVSLTVKGGYFKTLDFMDRLLDLPRIVVLDTISVSADGTAAPGAPALAVSLTGRLFTTEVPASAIPPPPTPAAAAAAAPSTKTMVG